MFDIVIIGDINIDHHIPQNLDHKFTDLSENGVIIWKEIFDLPGGSGLNMARFARQMDFSTLLLGNVGVDYYGKFLSDWLKNENIEIPADFEITGSTTGRAMILRDNAGIRLVINNEINANDLLQVSVVQKYEDAIRKSKILYISGYSLSKKHVDRYDAVKSAMTIAKSASSDTIIVFDVVPHRMYEIFNFDEFLELTENVDVLISEVSTIRRFLNLGNKDEIIDRDLSMETLELSKKYFNNIIFRFGASGCDEQLFYKASSNSFKYESTDHDLMRDKRGLGDKLALVALRDFYKILT